MAGKNVLVTGVTGFLGQAIFERLLKDFPGSPDVHALNGTFGLIRHDEAGASKRCRQTHGPFAHAAENF